MWSPFDSKGWILQNLYGLLSYNIISLIGFVAKRSDLLKKILYVHDNYDMHSICKKINVLFLWCNQTTSITDSCIFNPCRISCSMTIYSCVIQFLNLERPLNWRLIYKLHSIYLQLQRRQSNQTSDSTTRCHRTLCRAYQLAADYKICKPSSRLITHYTPSSKLENQNLHLKYTAQYSAKQKDMDHQWM
jgi:hypothetical protein